MVTIAKAIPSMVFTMCKQHGYRKVKSDVPFAFKLVRKEEPNPQLYCTVEGVLFKPYWVK